MLVIKLRQIKNERCKKHEKGEKSMNEPPRPEYVARLLYTLLGKEQGVEYDKVFYTDKDGVEHEVKKEEPYH